MSKPFVGVTAELSDCRTAVGFFLSPESQRCSMMNEAVYFNRVRENVGSLRLLSIFMEVILIGLALAVATAWSEFIAVTSEYWLSTDIALPLVKLISASIVTALAMFLAALTIFYFYFKPRQPPTPPPSPKHTSLPSNVPVSRQHA